jgi:hypothetical protein
MNSNAFISKGGVCHSGESEAAISKSDFGTSVFLGYRTLNPAN